MEFAWMLREEGGVVSPSSALNVAVPPVAVTVKICAPSMVLLNVIFEEELVMEVVPAKERGLPKLAALLAIRFVPSNTVPPPDSVRLPDDVTPPAACRVRVPVCVSVMLPLAFVVPASVIWLPDKLMAPVEVSVLL